MPLKLLRIGLIVGLVILTITANRIPALALETVPDEPSVSQATNPAGSGTNQALVVYQTRLKRLNPKDPNVYYQLGLWCKENDLIEQSGQMFEQTIKLDPNHKSARKELGYTSIDRTWVKKEELETYKKERDRTEKLLHRIKSPRIKEEEKKKIFEELAAIKPECKVKPLVDTLYYSPHQESKVYAVRELGLMTDSRIPYPLVNASLYDKTAEVRTEALNSLKKLRPAKAESYFIQALDNESPLFRARAVLGLQNVGSPKTAGILIKKLVMTYTGFGRGHIYIGEQFSYVKDYDIIIASPPNAMVDPIVDTVTEGTVLDVDVIRVDVEITIETERTIVGNALNHLTGQDFGVDAAKWAAWWNENKKEILAQ